MYRPGGVIEVSDGLYVHRADTVNCKHCGTVCERKQLPTIKGLIRSAAPPDDDVDDDIAGMCGGCGKPICVRCARKGQCKTLQQLLDEIEAADGSIINAMAR